MLAKINVAILIYPGVEMVDMNGPMDAFLKANSYNNSRYNIYTLAETADALPSEHSAVTLKATYTISDCPEPGIIVIPGQVLSENPYKFGSGSKVLVAWIKEKGTKQNIIVMSVCVGAYILANTGLLSGRKATTHYEAISIIQAEYPEVEFVKNIRYVHDGNLVTTGGITSGIDGALYLIETLDGATIAQHTADTLVYNREAPLPPYTLLPPYDN